MSILNHPNLTEADWRYLDSVQARLASHKGMMSLREPHMGVILQSATGEELRPLFWADAANIRRRCERSEPSRYRLNREDFSEIPFPDIKSVQAKIVQEINARTSQARQLREAAEREWQEAKEIFEKALLG